MNDFKTFSLLFFIQICALNGMEESTIKLKLQYSDDKFDEQTWDRADFDKITPFKQAQESFGNSQFIYKVDKDKSYITHEYLKNLITGNFINQGLTKYISDYKYFIGNDIQLELNEKYNPIHKVVSNQHNNPFISSLKWKVLKDNEDFFQININFGKDSVRNALKEFLSPIQNQKGEFVSCLSNLTTAKIDSTSGATVKEYPACKCYYFSTAAFSGKELVNVIEEQFDEKERCTITCLSINNSSLFELNLKELVQCLPNLYKVTAKNTFIKTISAEDIMTLKKLRNKNVIPSAYREDPLILFHEDNMFMIDLHDDLKNVSPKLDIKKLKKHASEVGWYSFILDLRGCQIKNSEIFSDLKTTEADIYYKKLLWLKGIKGQAPQESNTLFNKTRKIFLSFIITTDSGFTEESDTLFNETKKIIYKFFLMNIVNLTVVKIIFMSTSNKFFRFLTILCALGFLFHNCVKYSLLFVNINMLNSTGCLFT